MTDRLGVRTRWTLDPDKVIERRLERGMTQRGLAMCAEISPQLLNDIERGRRAGSPPVRAAIARALGVKLRDLCQDRDAA